MEWDSLGRWFRNLLTVSAVALVLHEHIPKNAECFGTTYLMFLARKWMRIFKQTIMRVQVIIGLSLLHVLYFMHSRNESVGNFLPVGPSTFT